jgi:hypothetical protein
MREGRREPVLYSTLSAFLDDIGDLKTLNRIQAMIERQARLIQTFATKLRLTQQSRYTAATAAVASGKVSGVRPWDKDK